MFQAGTVAGPDGAVVTAGGRVLGVTALGDTLGDARTRAYAAVGDLTWPGVQYRGDIALGVPSPPPLPLKAEASAP